MSVTVLIDASKIDYQQYKQVLNDLGMDNNPGTWPEGMIVHIAGPTSTNWRIIDVWDSMDHFEIFLNNKLSPSLKKFSIPVPKFEFFENKNLYVRIK